MAQASLNRVQGGSHVQLLGVATQVDEVHVRGDRGFQRPVPDEGFDGATRVAQDLAFDGQSCTDNRPGAPKVALAKALQVFDVC